MLSIYIFASVVFETKVKQSMSYVHFPVSYIVTIAQFPCPLTRYIGQEVVFATHETG